MVFSSVIFLCFFLPVVYIAFTAVRGIRAKNIILMLASILFYAYGEPVFVFVLLAVAFLHYIFVLLGEKYQKLRTPLLVVLVLIDVFLLFSFKYCGFFTTVFNDIFNTSIPVTDVEMPIGISFFTFQIMSYAVDAYKNKDLIQRKFTDLLLYISFFPQLIAGPIIKYSDVAQQIKYREITPDKQLEGFRRFIFGLAQKVLISNSMAYIADSVFSWSDSEITMPAAWLAAVAYSMQIYHDFCGYSNMAIGMGKIFGFDFMENFNYPYTALSITDFWKRWHISLTTWFREYVYIPLGGNRKGKARTCLNIFIVFLLTGLWHGAAFTFIVWGIYYAFFMIMERLEIIPVKKIKSKIIKHAYVIFVVFTGFVLFRTESLSRFGVFLKALFSFGTFAAPGSMKALSVLSPWFLFMLAAAIVFSCPFVKNKLELNSDKKAVRTATNVVSVLLLVICMVFLITDSYNPFIYFNF